MVLGILIAIVSAPALLGSQEAIRQSQSKEKREEHRARRCNLIASCVKSSARSREIDGRPVVLRNGKLWIDTTTEDGVPFGHTYAGYYLPYPDSDYEGLVTTITDVAPMLNWVYIDKDTHEAKYGVRVDAQPNLTGPFDCSRQDRRLTFEGWEGWCVVEEAPSLWALYFDKDDDGLKSKVAPGTRVLDVELSRKETRWKKESEARQQDQTTKREVDTKEDAPTDGAITSQPTLNPPGVGVPPPDEATDGLRDNTTTAAPTLKPLSLPKSIFSNPPRPIFAHTELLPSSDEAGGLPIPKSIFEGAPLSPPPAYSQAPYTPPQAAQAPSRTPSPHMNIPPPQQPEGSPATNEKRTTPKLNRKSGSRTMSQAQMFESLAAGKTLNDGSFRNKSKSPSRPISDATSVSDYDNPPKTTTTEIFQLYSDRESNYFPPVPVRPSVYDPPKMKTDFEAADPAVFGASSSTSSNVDSRRQLTANDRIEGKQDGAIKNKTQLREPFVPVRGKTTTQSGASNVSQTRRTDGKAPEKLRSGTLREPATPNSSRSNTVRPSSKGTSESRSRMGSFSTRPRDGDASRASPTRPKPLSRTNTTPARRPMTATMTSGTGNRAMATRLGSSSSISSSRTPDLPRSKTNSGLMRDLDELIAGGERSRSNTVSSAASVRDSGKSADRTSEDKQPPSRRGISTRDSARDKNRIVGRGATQGARDVQKRRGTASREDGGDPAVQR
ncbi:unnamed protein product [Periconia digitata]|uniref:Uncharacterized protein n=1 Tax=Periconia digitata TaxID=1303443 RepID=A0A9W4U5W7_9PLEO|nr:unnamed protein product [Periconia digitata]